MIDIILNSKNYIKIMCFYKIYSKKKTQVLN